MQRPLLVRQLHVPQLQESVAAFVCVCFFYLLLFFVFVALHPTTTESLTGIRPLPVNVKSLLFYILPAVGVGVLLILALWCYCCCCRKTKAKDEFKCVFLTAFA